MFILASYQHPSLPQALSRFNSHFASRCFDQQRLPSRFFEPCQDLTVDRYASCFTVHSELLVGGVRKQTCLLSALCDATSHARCRSATIALAVCVVLLLLVLIISVVVLYIKHRRIYSAYSQVTRPKNCPRAPGLRKPHTFASLFAAEGGQRERYGAGDGYRWRGLSSQLMRFYP